MATVKAHDHSFPPDNWPFAEPVNTAAYSTKQVLSRTSPVLVVYHDHEGDWQFLHSEDPEEDDCVLVCLGCAFQLAPAVAELASLPSGWVSVRTTEQDPWASTPYEDNEPPDT